MKATPQLVNAIDTAADWIEQDIYEWEWSDCHRCNCALVVCAALGIKPEELEILHPTRGCWDDAAATWFESNDEERQSISQVIPEMIPLGLESPDDYGVIEYLGKNWATASGFTDIVNTVNFLRELANKLRLELNNA